MEFRDLEVFVAVVRTRSFTRAAELSFCTQPAVSLAVRRLEKELGTILVARRRRGVEPTGAGRILMEHASELLGRRDSLRWEISRWAGLEKGELRIGTTDAVSQYLLPSVYRTFRKRYPGVSLWVTVEASAPLARRALSGECDLVVLTFPPPVSGLRTWDLAEEALVVVVSPSHPLGKRRRISPETLSGEIMIGYPMGSVTRGEIDRALQDVGAAPRVEMELGAPEAMKRLVEVGLGFAVLPERLVRDETRRGRLVQLSVRGFTLVRRLGFATSPSRQLTPAAREFMQLAWKRLKTPAKRSPSEQSARIA